MDTLPVAAALLSALLHASWNAAVKGSADAPQAMAAQMYASGLIALAALPAVGLPHWPSLPWMAVSVAFSLGSVALLLRAYRHTGFGVAYPVTRGASVMLVVPLAAVLAGEWPRPLGLAGVALVAAAVLALALRGSAAVARAGLGWALAAAAFTAAYVVCDARGVRASDSPLAYGCTLSVVNALVWGFAQRGMRGSGSPLQALRAVGAKAWAMALAAVASYVLILWVWSRAPIALGSALRDTSALWAALIAVLWLKEPIDRVTLGAIALATAGAALIRLA
jgi:drug/metabolite transporter (DMT)-like permease